MSALGAGSRADSSSFLSEDKRPECSRQEKKNDRGERDDNVHGLIS